MPDHDAVTKAVTAVQEAAIHVRGLHGYVGELSYANEMTTSAADKLERAHASLTLKLVKDAMHPEEQPAPDNQ